MLLQFKDDSFLVEDQQFVVVKALKVIIFKKNVALEKSCIYFYIFFLYPDT